MSQHKAVVGLFGPESDADQVVAALLAEGYADGDISIIGPGRSTSSAGDGTSDGHQRGADAALGVRVAWGAGVAGAAGLLATAGVLTLPGFGPILALGPLAGTLTAAAGGGLVGALVDWGIPEDASKRYQQQVREGNFLILLKAVGDASRAMDCMGQHGAHDVYVN